MKYLMRMILFNIFALFVTNQIFPGMTIKSEWWSIIFAGFILALLRLLIQPMLKIVFIPINLITFGLLAWFVNVIVIYLLTWFVPEVTIQPWNFPGVNWAGFIIPSAHLSYIWSLITASLLVTCIANLLHEVSE